MDMYNISPPASTAGLQDLRGLADLFNMKASVQKKLDEMIKYSKDCEEAYKKVNKELTDLLKARKEAEKVMAASENAADEVSKLRERLEEEKRSFVDFRSASLNDIEEERSLVKELRDSAEQWRDRLDAQQKQLDSRQANLDADYKTLEADKLDWSAKLNKIKAIGI